MRLPLRRHARRFLPALLIIASIPLGAQAEAPPGFVTRSGSGLTIDGKPWRAIGVNVWDFNPSKVTGQDITGCYYQHPDIDAYLDTTFAKIAAETRSTAVRTFGFRSMYTAGARDWSATDKLLFYAQKYNVRLIPVFGDAYPTCGAPTKDAAWYRSGYKKVEQPWGISFRNYVVEAVKRYRASPTIAMWQIMNEAVLSDQKVLSAFSRDMVTAIRSEAKDAHHLINLGTGQASRPAFDSLMSCSTTGGCNDIGTAHAYDPVDVVPGAPLLGMVTSSIGFANSNGDRNTLGVTMPSLEAWTVMKASPQAPGGGRQYTDWSIRLTAPKGEAWTAYIDDIRVVTQGSPQLYSFETGTEGFTATGAKLSASSKQARAGAAALRVSVPRKTEVITIRAPRLGGPPSSVEFSIRPALRAPGKRAGSGPAAMMHAAVVGARKPFFMGELGVHAAVPGLSKCSGYRSLDDRAAAVDAFMAGQLDAERGSSGVIMWDWKDPSLQSTLPDGRKRDDPTTDCWSLTPGDPVNAVIAKWAGKVSTTRLPAPTKRWTNRVTQVVLRGPGSVVARGAAIPITVRLTRGGDAFVGVRVTAKGCAGSGVTDALGDARFDCTVKKLGRVTTSVAPDPAACKCSLVATASVVSKRNIAASAVGSFVERGKTLPISVTLAEPNGSLEGVKWRIPECGLSGTIASGGANVTFSRSCRTTTKSWDAVGRVLTLEVPETATTAPAKFQFAGFAFDRVFVSTSGECIGLSPAAGWVGATSRSACASGKTSLRDSFVFQVPQSGRSRTFVAEGDSMVVGAEWKTGYRVDGRFMIRGADRSFTAFIARGGAPAPAAG